MRARRTKNNRRNLQVLSAATVACGWAGLAEAQQMQIANPPYYTIFAGQTAVVNSSGLNSSGNKYFALEGTGNGNFASWGVIDYPSANFYSLPGFTTADQVNSVGSDFSVTLYNSDYHPATSNVTLSFFLTTDSTTNLNSNFPSPLKYVTPSAYGGGLDTPGNPGSFAAGTSLIPLGTGIYDPINDQTADYAFTYPLTLSTAAENFIKTQINNGGDVRVAVTTSETDNLEAEFWGPGYAPPPTYTYPNAQFDLTLGPKPANDSILTVNGSKNPAPIGIGTLVTPGNGSAPFYAVVKSGGGTASVTLTNTPSSNDGAPLQYVVTNTSADASVAGTPNPIPANGTSTATVGFTSADTYVPGGTTVTGTATFTNISNYHDTPVSVNIQAQVIETRFVDSPGGALASDAPDIGKVLIGATGTTQATITTVNTDTLPDLSLDALTQFILKANATDTYTRKDPFTGTAAAVVVATAPNYDQGFYNDEVGTLTLAVTPSVSGAYGGANSETVGTTTRSTASSYVIIQNGTAGPVQVVGDNLPGESDSSYVYAQWTGLQPASLTFAAANTVVPGGNIAITNNPSTDNIYTGTLSATPVNLGLRAAAYVSAVNINQSGWTSTLTPVVTNPDGTVQSGTVIPGSSQPGDTNAYTMNSTVSFDPTNKINGTYTANLAVTLENELDAQGANVNDLGVQNFTLQTSVNSQAGSGAGAYTLNGGSLSAGVTHLTGSFTETAGTATFTQITGTGSVTLGANQIVTSFNPATQVVSTSALLKLAYTPGVTLGPASTVAALTINSGGQLDITNHPFVVAYGAASDPVATIRADLAAAYKAKYSGSSLAITSTTAAQAANHFAIGYVDNTTTKQLTLSLTVPGDTNLSGSTDFTDLTTVAQFFGQSVAKGNSVSWSSGDVNYDNQVDFNDLTIVAQYFGDSLTKEQANELPSSFVAQYNLALAETRASDVSSVPEPGSLSLLGIGAMGLLARRKRRN